MNIQTEIETCTITPLHHSRNYDIQVCEYRYREFEFTERTIFPSFGSIVRSVYNNEPPPETQYFYSFYVGEKPVVFKNSITADSPYNENEFYIVFKTIEEMIEYLYQR